MNKTELLLRMMEQPYKHTTDEWQEILADDECREFYTLMVKTQSAFDTAHTDEQVTDNMIESEWQRLTSEQAKAKHERLSIAQPLLALKGRVGVGSVIYKLAAALAALLMLSGITYAAISIAHHFGHETTWTNTESVSIRVNPMPPQSVAETDSLTVSPKLYDNVPLERMLTELAVYYRVKVSYRDDAARRLRLFYQWKPEYTIAKVIEMLNNFETLQLQLDGDTLFVSSTIDAQP